MPARTRVGICSWSTQPGSVGDLTAAIEAVGATAVQLAVDPIRTGQWQLRDTIAALGASGVEVRSTMMAMEGEDYASLDSIQKTGGVRLDSTWDQNLQAATANAQLTRDLGVDLVTFHGGFLPEDTDDPIHALMIERLRALADRFAQLEVRVALETGQESADTLLRVLDEIDRPNLGVNFDPANMILYAMGDPIEALRKLAPRVEQVHIKDAIATQTPGQWGTEVPVGQGQVDWPAFFAVLDEAELDCDLMIERESGDQRIQDLKDAYDFAFAARGANLQ